MTLAGFKRLFIFVLTQAWNSISDYHPNNGFHIGLEYLSREFQDIQKVWFWYITMPNFSSRSILSEASSRIISWSSSVFYKISQALKPSDFRSEFSKKIFEPNFEATFFFFCACVVALFSLTRTNQLPNQVKKCSYFHRTFAKTIFDFEFLSKVY